MNEKKFQVLLKKLYANQLIELDTTFETITDIELKEGDVRYIKPDFLISYENKKKKEKERNSNAINQRFHLNEDTARKFSKVQEEADKKKKQEEDFYNNMPWIEVPDSQIKRLCLAIAANHSLRRIIMPGKTTRIKDKHIDILINFFYNKDSLEIFNIKGNNFGDKNINKIVDTIIASGIEIVELNLYHNAISEIENFSELLESSKVKYLNLGFNALTGDILPKIKENNLYQLSLGYNRLTPESNQNLYDFISRTSVVELDLSWNKLDDSSAISIARALRNNNSLRVLDLSFNKFTEKGIRTILTVAVQHPSLVKVYLDENLDIEEIYKIKSQVVLDYMLAQNDDRDFASYEHFVSQFKEKIFDRKNILDDLSVDAKTILQKDFEGVVEKFYSLIKTKLQEVHKVEEKINHLENILLKSSHLPFYSFMKYPIRQSDINEDLDIEKNKPKV